MPNYLQYASNSLTRSRKKRYALALLWSASKIASVVGLSDDYLFLIKFNTFI